MSESETDMPPGLLSVPSSFAVRINPVSENVTLLIDGKGYTLSLSDWTYAISHPNSAPRKVK